jgi:cytochrome c2
MRGPVPVSSDAAPPVTFSKRVPTGSVPIFTAWSGRDIAAAAGFNYSAALAGIEGVWDYEHLFEFIRNPREYAPGTAMAFAGISNAQEIANLIAYMEAESN